MPQKFRKKPVVIEAVRYDGTNLKELENFVGGLRYGEGPYEIFIPTLEGMMQISVGDYVIRGVRGEHYPCKPDIFEKTYDKVEE